MAPGKATKNIPLKNAQYMVEEDTLTAECMNPSWRFGWSGTLTAGAADVEATRRAVHLLGLQPFQDHSRCQLAGSAQSHTADFAGAYGSLSSGGTTTKTNILHADAEHDWFLSPRLFALVDTSFDHNYSQGLSLQQIYGGGWDLSCLKLPSKSLI